MSLCERNKAMAKPTQHVKLYGIPNCDSVKKARTRLAAAGVAVDFHDFKKLGVPEVALDAWLGVIGADVLLNRRGTTWRGLDEAAQASAASAAGARALMLAQPSVIKRPVIEWADGATSVGLEALDARGMPAA